MTAWREGEIFFIERRKHAEYKYCKRRYNEQYKNWQK